MLVQNYSYIFAEVNNKLKHKIMNKIYKVVTICEDGERGFTLASFKTRDEAKNRVSMINDIFNGKIRFCDLIREDVQLSDEDCSELSVGGYTETLRIVSHKYGKNSEEFNHARFTHMSLLHMLISNGKPVIISSIIK